MYRRKMVALAALGVMLGVTPAFAKGPKVNDPPCSVSDGMVSASGLPTDQVINFMMSDASGSSAWVLGFTHDGSWSVQVPARNGATTYLFVSRMSGQGGSKYAVFSSCSA